MSRRPQPVSAMLKSPKNSPPTRNALAYGDLDPDVEWRDQGLTEDARNNWACVFLEKPYVGTSRSRKFARMFQMSHFADSRVRTWST